MKQINRELKQVKQSYAIFRRKRYTSCKDKLLQEALATPEKSQPHNCVI